MGTATTMNSLAEALGMQLPGGAAIPAPYRDRQEIAWRTGKRIVDMVHEDLKPSDILTPANFRNAIVVNSAIGGSTNAPIHITAIARHVGRRSAVDRLADPWSSRSAAGQPAAGGRVSGRGFLSRRRGAGGRERTDEAGSDRHGRAHRERQDHGQNCAETPIRDDRVIRPFDNPLKTDAGFLVLHGNLFDSAIMKSSVISPDFRARYLSNPDDPEAFEGRAVVFDGPEDYHARIDDPALSIDAKTLLFMRGAGPIGYPGAAEVVNMRPPDYLIKQGIDSLPCIGDGRQSGTSGSPSILNASPEAAAGGGLAILRTGDRVRIDLRKGTADILISDDELDTRRQALAETGGYPYPDHQTPWQEIQRGIVAQLGDGAVLKPAVDYQRIAQTRGLPRDNH
jgi:dihydroxy-acid dehydratase